MDRYLMIGCIVLGVALATITLYLVLPRPCPGPVTCTSDKQCGGTVVSDRFCKDGSVYGNGQSNTCVKKDRCTSTCQTNYGEVLVEKCAKGCNAGNCL